MTPDQKSALNQLFDEITMAGVMLEFNSRVGDTEHKLAKNKRDHLRTTFADRVCEIMKAKEETK